MDGDSQVGGNGSVTWEVNVNNTYAGRPTSESNGFGLRQAGTDPTKGPPQRPGDVLTVRVKAPGTMTGEEYIRRLREVDLKVDPEDPKKVMFELPIEEKNPDQIKINW